jgi:hypothetical protein
MLARSIREGVAHDGRFLNPAVMPYEFYRGMSDEDLASVIVYLRSTPRVKNEALTWCRSRVVNGATRFEMPTDARFLAWNLQAVI